MNPRYMLAAAVCCTLWLPGCSEQGGDGPQTPASATPAIDLADPATRTYDVVGVVASLPDPADPASEFRIDHEAIPDFVGASGEVVGMKAMIMPFPLAPGVSIDGLAVGDAVRFTFAVNWDAEASMPWELTKIEKADAR